MASGRGGSLKEAVCLSEFDPLKPRVALPAELSAYACEFHARTHSARHFESGKDRGAGIGTKSVGSLLENAI